MRPQPEMPPSEPLGFPDTGEAAVQAHQSPEAVRNPNTAAVFYFGRGANADHGEGLEIHGRNAEGQSTRALPLLVNMAVQSRSLHMGRLSGATRYSGLIGVGDGEYVVVKVEAATEGDDPYTLLATSTVESANRGSRVIGVKGDVDPETVIDVFSRDMPEEFDRFAHESWRHDPQSMKQAITGNVMVIGKDHLSVKVEGTDDYKEIQSEDVLKFTRLYASEADYRTRRDEEDRRLRAQRSARTAVDEARSDTVRTPVQPITDPAVAARLLDRAANLSRRDAAEAGDGSAHAPADDEGGRALAADRRSAASALSALRGRGNGMVKSIGEHIVADNGRLLKALYARGAAMAQARTAQAKEKIGSALSAASQVPTSVEWGPTQMEAEFTARSAERRLRRLEARDARRAAGEQTPGRMATVVAAAREQLAGLKAEYYAGGLSMQKVNSLAVSGAKWAAKAAAGTREYYDDADKGDARKRILTRAVGGVLLATTAATTAVLAVANFRAGNFDAIGDLFDQMPTPDTMASGPADGAVAVESAPAQSGLDVTGPTTEAVPAAPEPTPLPQETIGDTQTGTDVHPEVQADVQEVTLRDYDSETGDGTIEGQTMQEIEAMGISTEGLSEQQYEEALNDIRTETLELNGKSETEATQMHEGDTFKMLERQRIEEIMAHIRNLES